MWVCKGSGMLRWRIYDVGIGIKKKEKVLARACFSSKPQQLLFGRVHLTRLSSPFFIYVIPVSSAISVTANEDSGTDLDGIVLSGSRSALQLRFNSGHGFSCSRISSPNHTQISLSQSAFILWISSIHLESGLAKLWACQLSLQFQDSTPDWVQFWAEKRHKIRDCFKGRIRFLSSIISQLISDLDSQSFGLVNSNFNFAIRCQTGFNFWRRNSEFFKPVECFKLYVQNYSNTFKSLFLSKIARGLRAYKSSSFYTCHILPP